MNASTGRHAILLQILVIVAASTAVLGRLIELPASLLVMWRTALAAVMMLAWLLLTRRAQIRVTRVQALSGIAIGVLMGLHWITFFGSIRLSNISVCLAGLASLSFFTSLTEPLIERRKPRLSEVMLGLMVIPGILLIAGATWHHITGFICALVSAFLASLFPVLNRRLTLRGMAPETLTLYEMLGAAVTCLLASFVISRDSLNQLPTMNDWLWLGILSTVCTVWASSTYIYLLRYYSAFTTNLALNFEPVYGILLAAIIFGEHNELHPLFYLGTACIVGTNIIHGILRRYRKKTP